ncbi:hypothetical protein C3F09_02555 [candidate division GN15 bacterium]|uniref:DUF362 domain-containing protein n=1 Tax=candidate division GN15 bacterium TaxID=2072418 RepID=A0A855X691_9BACT|nr:MAG: hypothetical protein C3F09_02555 [candidate division GN15 bacterium]
MSSVVVVKYSNGELRGPFDLAVYSQLLTAAFCLLTRTSSVTDALHKLVRGSTIGIKTNCVARKFNSTPVPLVDALTGLLVEAGYFENDLLVWDRTSRELSGAGFVLNATSKGVRCAGTDANGIGYSRSFYSSGEVNSLVSRILTELVDCNINVPILKDHSIAGMSAGLKNLYGAINNPNKYHADGCNPFCAHVSALEPIRSKNRLAIIDAVRVQYQGGPGYMPDYVAPYHGLIVSDDPIAADRVALEILEHLRKVNGQPTLEKDGRPVKYLATAESIGLGMATLSRIDLRVVELSPGGEAKPAELLS